jgi:hypothetical protein
MTARQPLTWRGSASSKRRIAALIPLFPATSGEDANESEVLRYLFEEGFVVVDPALLDRVEALATARGQSSAEVFRAALAAGVAAVDPSGGPLELPPEADDAGPKVGMGARFDAGVHERVDALRGRFVRTSRERVTKSEVMRRLIDDGLVASDPVMFGRVRRIAAARGGSERSVLGEMIEAGLAALTAPEQTEEPAAMAPVEGVAAPVDGSPSAEDAAPSIERLTSAQSES